RDGPGRLRARAADPSWPAQLRALESGRAVRQPRDERLPLLVPLLAPRADAWAGQPLLLGVLAVGPQRSGRGYTREDAANLLGLADQAGTALYVAQLFQDRPAASLRHDQPQPATPLN